MPEGNADLLKFEHAQLLALFFAHLNRGDVFLDVGANVGYFAIPIARHIGSRGTVYAFEPSADTARQLRAKSAASGVGDWVVVREIALASHNGILPLYADNDYPRDSSKRSLFVAGPVVAKVPVRALDDMIDEGDLTLVHGLHAVKVDVEGAELRVLRGMRKTLRAHRPRLIVVETIEHQVRRARDRVVDIHRFLSGLGYRSIQTKAQTYPYAFNTVFAPTTEKG